jgi:hypothetical protein
MYENKTIAVIDYRADSEIIENLKKLNIHVLTTRKHEVLAEPVNGHPDMVMFQENYVGIIVSPEEYDYYMEKLLSFNIDISKGCRKLEKKYPENICYNGLLIGACFFHKLDSTDEKILNSMDERKIKCINVSQGYTKCSTVNMGKKGIITSDNGIWKVAREEGIDALLISHGYIGLNGYDYGFIGGATGFVDNKLYFTGSIKKHPDCRKIMNFLNERNIETVFLSEKNIYDLGTIIFLKQRKL